MRTSAVVFWILFVLSPATFAASEVGWIENGTPLTLQWGSVSAAAIASDGASGAIVAYQVCREGASLIIAQRVDESGAVLWGDGIGVCVGTWGQSLPQIVADGAGGGIVVWSDSRTGSSGLYAQRIDAAGSVQWGADGITVCASEGSPSGSDLRSDGSGGALVGWVDGRSGNTAVYVQCVDHSGSAQWTSDGVCVCSETGAKSWVKVVPDAGGGAFVAWSDGRSGSYDVYAQRVDASGSVQWALSGVPLCTASGTQGMPEMISDNAGGAIVAWSDYRTGYSDIYAQRVSAAGECQWAADGTAVCSAASTQYYLSLVSDGAYGAIIVWQDFRSGNYDIYAQRLDPAGSFKWESDGIPLCTAADDQRSPKIILDGEHETIVAWRDYRSGESDIYAQRVDSSGAVEWTMDGLPLCAEAGEQVSHAIATTDLGGVIAAWAGPCGGRSGIYAQWADSSGVVQWAAGGVSVCYAAGNQVSARPVQDEAGGAIVTWQDDRNGDWDIYAQRVNPWGIILWVASGVPVCVASGGQGEHMSIPDGAGGAFVVWEDSRGGDKDIYVQQIDGSGNALWTSNGVVVCSATGDQYYPKIVSDGAGGAIVTWNDARAGTWTDIYAQRVDASGVIMWTLDGVPLCQATGLQLLPHIASDGAHGAIVAWMDYGDVTVHACAQRVDSSGAVVWTANGIRLCTASGSQVVPLVMSDGAGGAFFVWGDGREGGSTTKVYAQRVDAAGALQWPSDGLPVCTATGSQHCGGIVPDGSGGAIVTWEDDRWDGDIYAQRINGSGVAQWAPGGVPLCEITGEQGDLSTDSDGAGGAIVAWRDERDARSDIYAQRVTPSGIVVWPTGGVALCTNAAYQGYPDLTFDAEGGAIVVWRDSRCATSIHALRVHSSGKTTDASAVPLPLILHQNYPNPFNPRTVIRFYLPRTEEIVLDVYNVAGELMTRLIEGKREKGYHEVSWDGRNSFGIRCASGVYFSRLTAGQSSVSRKMVILR